MLESSALSHGETCSAMGEQGMSKRLLALGRLDSLEGERLLDIGCADGSYTLRLAEGFERVDAIDVEPERLRTFREKVSGTLWADRVTIAEMSADGLSYPNESFDVITAIEVLEHVRDLDGTFAEVARVLKPAGRFLVTTPNRWFPFETHGPIIAGRRRKVWHAPGITWVGSIHRRCSDARAFTLKELREGAARHGLGIAGHEYIMPPFDRNRIGQALRPLTDRLERSPVGFLGMAHVIAYVKS